MKIETVKIMMDEIVNKFLDEQIVEMNEAALFLIHKKDKRETNEDKVNLAKTITLVREFDEDTFVDFDEKTYSVGFEINKDRYSELFDSDFDIRDVIGIFSDAIKGNRLMKLENKKLVIVDVSEAENDENNNVLNITIHYFYDKYE